MGIYNQFGFWGRLWPCGGVSGEPSPAVVYVNLLPVVEACVVVAVPGRVGEVRVPADEPEAVDLDPGVLRRKQRPDGALAGARIKIDRLRLVVRQPGLHQHASTTIVEHFPPMATEIG